MWTFKKKEPKYAQKNIYDDLEKKRIEYDTKSTSKTKFITCKHGFLFNNDLKKMTFSYFKDSKDVLIEKDFKDLIGCEYSKNNQIVGSTSTSGAIFGGMVAGAAGAVIGATTGQKTFLSLELKIFFNDFDFPIIKIRDEINFKSVYNSEKDRGFPIVKRYEELYGVCQFIINQNKIDQAN